MNFYIAFLLGLASSGHCFAMCGGLAVAFSGRGQPRNRRSRETSNAHNFTKNSGVGSIDQVLLFKEEKSFFNRMFFMFSSKISQMFMLNAGRICTYALFALTLTGIVKLIGSTVNIPDWSGILRLLTGVSLVVAGLQIGFKVSLFGPLEKQGECLFSKLKAPMQLLLPKNTMMSYFSLGLLWGFLPCGIVYSVVLLASSSGSYVSASLTVLGFGLGTIPMLLATGVFAGEIQQVMNRYQLKKALGSIVLLCGFWLISAPFLMEHFMNSKGSGMHCHSAL